MNNNHKDTLFGRPKEENNERKRIHLFFFFSLQKQVGYNKIYIILKIEKSFKKFKPYCIIQKETEMFHPFNMYNSVAFSILTEF